MDIININYISPMSTYKFDTINNKYYLVHMGLHSIHKIDLPSNINNINQQIRAFSINKAIKTENHLAYPTQDLMVFEHNINKNIIKLLFVAKLDLVKYDYGNLIEITMKQPSKVFGNFRSSSYSNDYDFMNEQFFNYESFEPEDNKCILFLIKVHDMKNSNKNIVEKLNITLQTSDKLLFNRYHNTIIKEQPVLQIDTLCKSNRPEDYLILMKHYNIDVNRYTKTNLFTFRELFLRQINLKFRPLVSQYYFNNLINAPADGRVKAFNINSEFRLKIMNCDYSLSDIIGVSFTLNNGSGMMTRLTPGDYQRASMPYPGYLTEISIASNYTSLKFESTYFMPPSVKEREYISVLYGHNVSMSRDFPELVEVQPRIKLIFYVILFGKDVILTNKKLLEISRRNIRIGIPYETILLEKGEEIGGFNCCQGHVLFITNRPIDFTNDIRYYTMNKNIECYIKNKDIFGLLL